MCVPRVVLLLVVASNSLRHEKSDILNRHRFGAEEGLRDAK